MNIAMLLEMTADAMGDRVAIGSREGGVTYEHVRRAAVTLANEVDTMGVASLALLHPTGPIVPTCLFGAAYAGVTYSPINFRLPEHEQDELLARVQPAHVINQDHTWHAPDDVPGRAYPESPERPAVLLFTSGSSAAPKAAVLHHQQLLSYVFNTLEFMSADEDEAALLSVPPFHVAGVASILSSTYIGRRIVPLTHFTAESWLETVRDENVTHAMVVPTMLARIVAIMEAEPELRVPSLRQLSYGGARMPAPILERALELMPAVGFVNAYGLTETSSTVCVLGPDDHWLALASEDPVLRGRLASVGQPVPGIEVRIAAEDGSQCEPGEPGELLVRGAQVSGEYVGVESKRDEQGWLHTGDRAWVDDDGYVFVEGRGDETIIRGGENIAPAEIEDTLMRHPAVHEAGVVGLPDIEWGARIAAAVTIHEGHQVEPWELHAFAREHLGSLKTPEHIEIWDELPQTATHKILRRAIREELERRLPPE